jgi:hypothetical protein
MTLTRDAQENTMKAIVLALGLTAATLGFAGTASAHPPGGYGYHHSQYYYSGGFYTPSFPVYTPGYVVRPAVVVPPAIVVPPPVFVPRPVFVPTVPVYSPVPTYGYVTPGWVSRGYFFWR